MEISVINKLFGKDLINAMNELLSNFENGDYDEKMIYKALRGINESVRMGLYLIALNNNKKDLAYKINKANKALNDLRKEQFILAYKTKNVDRFLAVLGKSDKISLMSDLGIDKEVKDRAKFTKEQKDYYRIISNSIMLDQEDDQRDGIDRFIKYKG